LLSSTSPPDSLSTAPPPTELYTLPLHDALPICPAGRLLARGDHRRGRNADATSGRPSQPALRHRAGRADPRAHLHRREPAPPDRSEEHTSELQSRENLVCRLLLEKKKKDDQDHT